MAVLIRNALAIPGIAIPALALGLALPLAIPLAGCYAPELPDCVVACTVAADCAPGHVCGTDAWCAAPSVAGQCSALAVIDAGPGEPADARTDAATPMLDAFTPPADAPPAYTLTVKIGGRGVVVVEGIGQCDHTAADKTCSFPVALGLPLEVTAIPLVDTRFDKWNGGPCVGQDETCQLIPILLTTSVEAKFRNGAADDD